MPEYISAPALVPQRVVLASLDSVMLMAQAASRAMVVPFFILMNPMALSSTS